MSSSRPQPTLADYMAIAISPALIIVLVGSLAFFLLTVVYAGAFEQRMYWTTACFVFAAVLISRISIVEGAERASLFGLALGAVAGLAMMRFTTHPWFAWFVLGAIWWAASHLVWNCTLVDDEDDASGVGLLEAAGLDPESIGAASAAVPSAGEATSGAGAAKAATTSAAQRKKKAAASEPPPATPQRSLASRFFSWWQTGASRAAPPGLAVVYFSLAALPIFGVGQKFVQIGDRQYAFQLMVRYAAAALGLLLTTSFLGLRRYLRQGRLEMPVEMAGTWLGVGTAMGVAILLLALLIPRPNPEYAISSLSGMLSSPSRQASQTAPLHDSPAEGNSSSTAPAGAQTPHDQQAPANPTDAPPADGQSRSGGAQPGSTDGTQPPSGGGPAGQQAGQNGNAAGGQGGGKAGENQGQQQSNGQQQGSSDQQNAATQQNAPSRASDNQQGSQTQNGQSREAAQGQRSQPQDASQQGDQSAEPKRSDDNADKGKSASSSAGGGQSEERRQADASQKQQGSSRAAPPLVQHPQQVPTPQPPLLPQSFGGMLLWLMKMVLYIVVLVVGIYCLLRYWPEIKLFLSRAWQELIAIWQSLFGGRRKDGPSAGETADAPRPAMRPFDSFQDPFATGMARRHSPNAIVQYSFEAFEAWAAERGLARLADETPLEFATRIAAAHPSLADDAQYLASLYARVAYARETLAAESLGGVERLWSAMRATAAPRAAVVAG